MSGRKSFKYSQHMAQCWTFPADFQQILCPRTSSRTTYCTHSI